MRILPAFAVVAALAVLTVGCESFRGDDGKGDNGSAKKEKSARKRKGKRDPYNDMFFGLDGAKAKSFANDDLSPREQSLLDEELRRQDDEMRGIKRMHRDMDSNRSKRKEWIYGFKPLGSDK